MDASVAHVIARRISRRQYIVNEIVSGLNWTIQRKIRSQYLMSYEIIE